MRATILATEKDSAASASATRIVVRTTRSRRRPPNKKRPAEGDIPGEALEVGEEPMDDAIETTTFVAPNRRETIGDETIIHRPE